MNKYHYKIILISDNSIHTDSKFFVELKNGVEQDFEGFNTWLDAYESAKDRLFDVDASLYKVDIFNTINTQTI